VRGRAPERGAAEPEEEDGERAEVSGSGGHGPEYRRGSPVIGEGRSRLLRLGRSAIIPQRSREDMDDEKKAAPPVEAEVLTEETTDGVESLLELVLEEHEARVAAEPPPRIEGVVVGALVALDPAGAARVAWSGGPADGVPAKLMAPLAPADVGCEVALLFEGGDPARPVIMGKMHVPGASTAEVKADGDRLELRAGKEIVLSCGDASITLTRAGKILIRGAYVLSRSSGVHRIQGGSVQIN
jgi:hypothetical protein